MALKPAQRAREAIDTLLDSAEWLVQDMGEFNRNAAEGVAVREFQRHLSEPHQRLWRRSADSSLAPS